MNSIQISARAACCGTFGGRVNKFKQVETELWAAVSTIEYILSRVSEQVKHTILVVFKDR